MEDLRYQQIESETNIEVQSQQSKFAFTGFGRSTDTGSAVDQVMKDAEKRKTQLATVINLEEELKQVQLAGGNTKSILQALSFAQNELNRLSQEARNRRAKVAEELMGVGQQEERKYQVGLKYRNSFKKKKGFTLKVKGFSYPSMKAQPIAKIQSIGSLKGFAPIKSLGKILSVGASKHFGSLKTLTNLNA